MKQTNHDEEIVIPEIINDTLVTFVAESFSNSDFCYKDCHAYELGFSNRILFPDTVRYIENIRAYLENNIEITADDDAYISADIMNAKSEYFMDMI